MEVLISTLYMMKRFNVMHILLNNNFEKGQVFQIQNGEILKSTIYP